MTHANQRAALVATAILALVLVVGPGCGGDKGSSAAPSPEVVTRTPASAPSGAAAKAAAVIDQSDLQFLPEKVSVRVGETVLIKNSEPPIHTANVNGKNISGNMKQGDSVTWQAPRVGEYKVTCDYHPAMKATIVVTS